MHERTEVTLNSSASQVALFHLENEDRHVVFHAEGDSCRIHDLETAGNDFLVADVIEAGCSRVLDRVCGVDAIDLGSLHDDVAFAFDSAEGSAAIRRKERIARTGREDDHGVRRQKLERAVFLEWWAA